MSVRIANSRGIPGTLGCLARTIHQHRPVFLTSCHVLFAGGGTRHDPVWQVHEAADRRNYLRLGSALQGKRGVLRYRGDDYFVDCAIGTLDLSLDLPLGLPLDLGWSPVPGASIAPRRGDHVWKSGAATGTTTGIIVDSTYCCSTDAGTALNGRMREQAPRQLLIRSSDQQRPFVEEGDSGALIRNEDSVPIGLLWGMTVAAEGIACPIDPVLHALNIELQGLTHEHRRAV